MVAMGMSMQRVLVLVLALPVMWHREVMSFAFVPYWSPSSADSWHSALERTAPTRQELTRLMLQGSNDWREHDPPPQLNNETDGYNMANMADQSDGENFHLESELSLRRRQVLKWSSPILMAGLAGMAPGTGLFRKLVTPDAEAKSPPNKASEASPVIPFSSTRRYKRISLRNGLSVLLVSDKNVATCQAAMSIPAGQFYDGSVPGLAHLMEHMLLSTPVTSSTRRSYTDLESWLIEREGASNAFTAYQKVCFHLTCPKQVFSETLERFAAAFRQRSVESVCRDRAILRREIRRVDSELNFDSVYSQEEHLTKAFVNLEHPYSVFSKGSIESLEQVPLRDHVDVGDRLVAFFRRYYLPQRSFLVVIGPQDLSYLERWAMPFSDSLVSEAAPVSAIPEIKDYFPGQFLVGSRRYKQVILKRSQSDELPVATERLTMQWVTNLDYRNSEKLVTINEVAFVLSQIIGRRGPGSLYLYLKRRGWIPDTNINSLPRFTIPVDVSGFQILKLEISLTKEGFENRGEVVNTVYESINTVRMHGRGIASLSRDILLQYASVAKLFGYHLAPRPPDAIELAFDALVYDRDAVCSGAWYRFPSSLNSIRRIVGETLEWMSQPDNALIIVTANEKTLKTWGKSGNSRQWLVEPISGARFDFDDIVRQRSLLQNLVTESVGQQELLPPFFNPLVPKVLNAASSATKDRFLSEPEGEILPGWFLKRLRDGVFVPRQPLESEYGRCALVLQFLTPKPARANVRQSARGELWKLAFEYFVADLAELGSPGGLAYDISFNKFGVRFSFLGVSQTLPSYIRRMFRRLLEHQQLLLQPGGYPANIARVRVSAISSAKLARGLSPGRRARIISNLRSASMEEIGIEGHELLESITGVLAITQGELEADLAIIRDVNEILSTGSIHLKPFVSSLPSMDFEELYYKPSWKPRFASGCYVAGVNFMSDACGRIPR